MKASFLYRFIACDPIYRYMNDKYPVHVCLSIIIQVISFDLNFFETYMYVWLLFSPL